MNNKLSRIRRDTLDGSVEITAFNLPREYQRDLVRLTKLVRKCFALRTARDLLNAKDACVQFHCLKGLIPALRDLGFFDHLHRARMDLTFYVRHDNGDKDVWHYKRGQKHADVRHCI